MNIENIITEHIEDASRNHKPQNKIFYSHELSQEPLVNVLSRTKEYNPITDSLDISFKHLFEDFRSLTPLVELSSDWLINSSQVYSIVHNNKQVTLFLPVVLSTNRINEIIKQGKDNQYAMDLTTQRYAYNKQDIGYTITKLYVVAINRLYTYYRPMSTDKINFIEIQQTYSDNEIEQMLLDRTDLIDNHISLGSYPDKCQKLRWHKQKGKSKPMQCLHYCPVNKNCPYYSTRTRNKDNINSLIF